MSKTKTPQSLFPLIPDKIKIGYLEKKYNAASESLSGWIDTNCVQTGMSPEYAMVILMDRAIAIALLVSDDEDHARSVVEAMLISHIEERRNRNDEN